MKIYKTKINFKDKRGEIRDLFVGLTFDAGTLITCNKGSVRANHYHKKTVQLDYVLKGSFTFYWRKGLKGRVSKKVLKAGDVIVFAPGECHALKAREYAELLSFTHGPRKGKDYDSDTFRLDTPLVS